MANTNYFSGIVKILETPKNYRSTEQTESITVRVEISQRRKNNMVSLIFWGNLGREVKKFYKKNDYILIEGYVSIRPKKILKVDVNSSKRIFITVIKIYPILLDSNRDLAK